MASFDPLDAASWGRCWMAVGAADVGLLLMAPNRIITNLSSGVSANLWAAGRFQGLGHDAC